MSVFAPRHMKASMIEEGDEIVVTLPTSMGVTMSLAGRAYREIRGERGTTWYTKEGGQLVTWSSREDPRIVLMSRAPLPHSTLEGVEEIAQSVH